MCFPLSLFSNFRMDATQRDVFVLLAAYIFLLVLSSSSRTRRPSSEEVVVCVCEPKWSDKMKENEAASKNRPKQQLTKQTCIMHMRNPCRANTHTCKLTHKKQQLHQHRLKTREVRMRFYDKKNDDNVFSRFFLRSPCTQLAFIQQNRRFGPEKV